MKITKLTNYFINLIIFENFFIAEIFYTRLLLRITWESFSKIIWEFCYQSIGTTKELIFMIFDSLAS